MLTSAHFFSGVILFSLFSELGFVPHSALYLLILVGFSLIVDWDFVLSKMHRQSPTHTPVFWVAVSAILISFIPTLWVVLVAVLVHLLLDTLDWGVMLAWPLSRRVMGPKILASEVGERKLSTVGYLSVYVSHRLFITLEILFAAAAILSLVVTP